MYKTGGGGELGLHVDCVPAVIYSDNLLTDILPVFGEIIDED